MYFNDAYTRFLLQRTAQHSDSFKGVGLLDWTLVQFQQFFFWMREIDCAVYTPRKTRIVNSKYHKR